ncbi:hypothetical protein ACFVH7_12315 [Kitasatospora indigofera]|uniref:hypothetical protein n=1 Tax=Kitasatospora indigofera TaxID=67307 RepID=UPI0036314DF1
MQHTPPSLTRIGTRMAQEALGTDRLRTLAGASDPATPLGAVLRQTTDAVIRLDHVQDKIVRKARILHGDLQPIISGQDTHMALSTGVIATDALAIDLLIARRGDLHQHLTDLLATCRSLTGGPDHETTAPEPTAGHARASAADVSLNPAQEAALLAVAGGGVRMNEGLVSHQRRIAAVGIKLATVHALIDKKLVERDTSTRLTEGQALLLTAAGHRHHQCLLAADRTLAGRPPGAAAAAASAEPVAPPRSRR